MQRCSTSIRNASGGWLLCLLRVSVCVYVRTRLCCISGLRAAQIARDCQRSKRLSQSSMHSAIMY
jgi:hypothetical protein